MNVTTTKTRILGSVIACTATLGLSLAAQAGDHATSPPAKHDDVVVRYADLNLSTADGARTLYTRLSSAAKRACGGTPTTATLDVRAHFDACVDRTLNYAVDKVGSQQVQMLHATRTDSKVG